MSLAVPEPSPIYIHSITMAELAAQHHGKSRVRVGRVWRDGPKHTFVEWTVDTMLESDMEHAYKTESNAGMTATDTQKNTVYYIAKNLPSNSAPEDFAIALAKHFVNTYPLVSKAKVGIEQANWVRHQQGDRQHAHGFEGHGTGARTAYAEYSSGKLTVHGGVRGWKILKTTQSGYEGFVKDEYTMLKDTRERIVATSATATWKYSGPLPDYHAPFDSVTKAFAGAFFGPPDEGVYSPSVQYTLFRMAEAALQAVSAVESVYMNMPNVHFIPCNPVNSEPFADDVYVATSDPAGNIEAVVTRKGLTPHAKL